MHVVMIGVTPYPIICTPYRGDGYCTFLLFARMVYVRNNADKRFPPFATAETFVRPTSKIGGWDGCWQLSAAQWFVATGGRRLHGARPPRLRKVWYGAAKGVLWPCVRCPLTVPLGTFGSAEGCRRQGRGVGEHVFSALRRAPCGRKPAVRCAGTVVADARFFQNILDSSFGFGIYLVPPSGTHF